jgi:hypothetical protein
VVCGIPARISVSPVAGLPSNRPFKRATKRQPSMSAWIEGEPKPSMAAMGRKPTNSFRSGAGETLTSTAPVTMGAQLSRFGHRRHNVDVGSASR